MSWAGESEPVRHRDALWVVLGVIGAVAFVAAVLWPLNAIQSQGEAPAYTCNPESAPYVLEECR